MIQSKKKKEIRFLQNCVFLSEIKFRGNRFEVCNDLKKKSVDKTRLGESSSFFYLDDIALTYRIHNKHENSIL